MNNLENRLAQQSEFRGWKRIWIELRSFLGLASLRRLQSESRLTAAQEG